jgi:hypothetical protein
MEDWRRQASPAAEVAASFNLVAFEGCNLRNESRMRGWERICGGGAYPLHAWVNISSAYTYNLILIAMGFNLQLLYVMFFSYYTVLTTWTIIGTVIFTSSSSPSCTDFTHSCLLVRLCMCYDPPIVLPDLGIRGS